MFNLLIAVSFVAGLVTFPLGHFIVSKYFGVSKNVLWKILCASFAYLLPMMLLVIVVMITGIHSSIFMMAFLAGAVFNRLMQFAIHQIRS